MNWYLDVLKNYVGFSGRARRTEFWMFALINFIVAVVLGIIGAVIGTSVIGDIYALAVLLPSLAVAIRRLHDTGRSGWWLLIAIIPIIGWIILIVFDVSDSTPGENQYGPNPKELQPQY
ncbi:DUF805 domain-containing protein [Streptacidiphilus sp. PB12-B1b]|uniref:DUF805 domain-containing protein n=1 Tax=Streptacidiphilus sp. PB12-B1b TaxID=2705012 RepID=UPI0015FBD329|nr:DUF805 domain-containing protein [Streptacidiphilus sp. PB12-B1b]QMU78815.1 DUF805 domain-containing protein [Streptacidiphilus sp. PB12-B1b]